PTLLEILGYTEFETLRQERRAADLYVDEDLASLHLTHAEAEAESEAIWKRRDGSRIQVRITSRRVVDADAGLEYFEGFVSDVTERRRLQAQLESASRLQAVGRLTGGIAHDFNNLLTVIEGNLSLQQKVASSANVQDALEAGRRASELTKQLLSFARAQEGASPTTDAVPQTKVLARLLQRAFPESVDLRVQTESAALSVALPGPDLDQIVMNLVINARDALAKNARGSVLLELLTDRAAGAALLRVSDSGAGIDAELLPRLFEPFVSTRHGSGGTGLGLSILKEIVDRAGGSITVYSHAGFGTCFEVRSPLAPGAEKSQPPEAYSRSETGTILVVDDDRAVRRVTMRLLQIEGFDVIEASGVAEAKRALRPDLLAAVVDVVMGDGDGFEVLDEIAQRGLGVPALLMSGYPDRVLRERGRGTHPILAKPSRRAALVRELDALLRSAPPRRNQGAA
ncbi:MAG TPA: ATP-binding protein, partial [Polyangiaceae bacterium]|nr:ATP-binding protein [Polyangiaceae bacterium]